MVAMQGHGSDVVGRTFGRWVVQGRLVHGDFGALYAARATSGAPPRAAIRLTEVADDAEQRRFFAERHLLRTLSHPGVIKAHDGDFAGSGSTRLAYLVIELPVGASLVALVERRGALSIRGAADIAAQVASALGAVHADDQGTHGDGCSARTEH
jgi:serine/threonine protein kinase